MSPSIQNYFINLSVNSGGESVVGVVASFNDLIERLELDDLHDRSENFFFCDSHVIFDSGEHSRFDVESLVALGRPSAFERRPFFFARLNQVQDFVVLLLVNLRS